MKNVTRMLVVAAILLLTTAAGSAEQAPKETKAPGAIVTYTGVYPQYANAIAELASEARAVYADQFKFNMPLKVVVDIEKDPQARTNLWNDGDSHIFLTVRSSLDLEPPTKSGYFNIYGICHELGHIAMYRGIVNLGLPNGVAEGWPHYAGSVVVDAVFKKLGATLWPQPYDYAQTDGTARLAEQSSDPEAMKSPITKAAFVFYAIDRKYGTDKVMAAMNTAQEGKPYGKDLMPRFANALAKITGDQSAAAMVPADMLAPKVEWEVAEREINDKAVEGLIQEKDATGVLIRYDDGKSDGKRSIAGAGHAVVFKTPPGAWAVDSIQMYGSRYGAAESPKEDFSIFILDKDFNIIKQIDKPYSALGNGEEEWYKFDFDPVKVPEGFYVCIYFSPTAAKGFYMHYDKDVKLSHSRSALPFTFVNDVRDKYDWMVRVHLVGASN